MPGSWWNGPDQRRGADGAADVAERTSIPTSIEATTVRVAAVVSPMTDALEPGSVVRMQRVIAEATTMESVAG